MKHPICLLFVCLAACACCAFVQAQPRGAVTGTIIDSETGEPLPGVNVILRSTGRGATTASDGSFEVARVPPGTYTLQVSFVGYETATQFVAVQVGEAVRVDLVLAPAPTELETIIVEGRAANLVDAADAASQGQVSQVQLKTRPLLRPGEVMETVPGLIATQHSGSGKANQFFLRGFNLDHGTDFSATVEGMPVNLRTHAHGQGYLDINFLIPELIEVIQFEKGPYHAEKGDFATAGSAQVSLVDHLDEGIAKAEIGGNEYYRGLFANSRAIGRGDLVYGFQGRYYNGPWVNPENGALLSGLVKYSAGGMSNGYSLQASGYRNNWDATDQVAQRAVEEGRITRFGALDSTNGGATDRYMLIGNWWNTSPGRKRTRVTAYASYYRLNLFSNFTYFLGNPLRGDQFEQADRRLYMGTHVSHRWFTDWLGQRSTNVIGVDLRHDQIFEVALFETDDRRRLDTVRDDEVAESSLGVYLEKEVHWTDKLRTTVGLRGDIFRFDVGSNIHANSGTEADIIASPKVSMVLGPWHNTEYYLNLGLGYHSNDARGTTIQADPVTNESVSRVDPLVRSRGAEVGVRTVAISNLHSTLALWYLGLDSELVFVGDAGGTEASGASEHYGLEWNNYYEIADWLALDLDVALTESHYVDNMPEGREIPNSIGRVISGGISAGYPAGWGGSLRLRHFGPRPLTSDGRVESEATTLLNMKVGYGFENLELELDVLNLLDTEDPDISYFYASRLQGEPSAGVEDIHFHPVLPRTTRLSATWYF